MPVNETLYVSFDGNASGIDKASRQASAALGKFQNAAKGANQTLINFNRVVQDAPFGIIGIANNIDPLISSFQQLKTQTGSTGAALKSMFAGLAGPAGIALAVSAASSALIAFGANLFSSKQGVDENKAALEGLNRELDESKERLEGLSAAYARINDIGKINIDILFGKGFESELMELQAQSIQMFGNRAKLEEEINKRRDILTRAQEKNAVANTKESIQTEQDALRAFVDMANQREKLEQEHTRIFLSIKQLRTNEQRRIDEEAQQDAEKALEKLRDLLDRRQKMIDEFTFRFNDSQTGLRSQLPFPKIDFSSLPKDLELGNKILNERLDVMLKDAQRFAKNMKEALAGIKSPVTDLFSTEEMIKDIRDMFAKLEVKIPDISKQLVPMGTMYKKIFDDIAKDQEKMKKRLLETAETISGILAPAFQEMYNAILAGENPIKSFFEGIGQAVNQLIQKLIQAAIQAAVLSIIFPGGVGGIKGFGNIFKNILGFAKGGIAYGPTLGVFGEYAGAANNPEIVAPLNKLKDLLPGAGGGNANITGELRIRGNDLVLAMARNNRRQGRVG